MPNYIVYSRFLLPRYFFLWARRKNACESIEPITCMPKYSREYLKMGGFGLLWLLSSVLTIITSLQCIWVSAFLMQSDFSKSKILKIENKCGSRWENCLAQGWPFLSFQCMNHGDFTNSEAAFLNKWLLKGFVIYLDFAANTSLFS